MVYILDSSGLNGPAPGLQANIQPDALLAETILLFLLFLQP